MVRTEAASWNIKRPCGVTCGFQVSKHLVEVHSDDSRNIFAKEPSGSEGFNNANNFRPEVTVICLASLLPGNTKRLAGPSSANKVNWFEVVCSTIFYISESLNVRPVFGEDFVAEGVVFDLPHNLHPCSFKAQVEATYA
jgi:hypothetical protein